MIDIIKAVYLFLALAVGVVAATVGSIWGLYELHLFLDSLFTARGIVPSEGSPRPASVAIAFAVGGLFLAVVSTLTVMEDWRRESEDEDRKGRMREEWDRARKEGIVP